MGSETPLYIRKELGEWEGLDLTQREMEVVNALMCGRVTRGEIAQALCINERTAHTHLYRIYAKTGAINLADLVLMVVGRKSCPVDFSDVVWGE